MIDFGVAWPMIRDRQHHRLAALMTEELHAQSLAGCDFSLICCNTAHQALPHLPAALARRVLPIMDTVARQVADHGWRRVALLSTSSTAQGGLYQRALEAKGAACLLPSPTEQAGIDRIVFDELMFGRAEPASRDFAAGILLAMKLRGARAAILGCTELPMLLGPADSALPLLDCVELHCRRAVALALEA
jgi:aspartate racemase